MKPCLECEEAKIKKKREQYENMIAKAKQFAKDHELKILYIVQTKNFPIFKREQDIGAYPILETLLFD